MQDKYRLKKPTKWHFNFTSMVYC